MRSVRGWYAVSCSFVADAELAGGGVEIWENVYLARAKDRDEALLMARRWAEAEHSLEEGEPGWVFSQSGIGTAKLIGDGGRYPQEWVEVAKVSFLLENIEAARAMLDSEPRALREGSPR